MPNLRLFANLREIAGSAAVQVGGVSVGEVLDNATRQFGSDFAAGLETSQVWVNGDPAQRSTAVADSDEIAVIPPVSGGAEPVGATTTSINADWNQLIIVTALVAALFAANAASLIFFVLAVVAVGLAWVWDLIEHGIRRGVPLNIFPPLVAVAAAANGAYAWGYAGFAIGVAVGIAATLVWAVLKPEQRTVDAIAITGTTALIAALGAGAAVLLRLESETAVYAFLVVALAGTLAAAATVRLGEALPVDPSLSALIGALIAALVVGLVADSISVAVMLLGAAALVAGIVAGSAFGALVRSGSILHNARPPGILSSYDGAYLGTALFWLIILILA